MKHSKGFLALVKAAKKKIKETTPQGVMERFKKDTPFRLLDVREDDEFSKGWIRGATHMSKGTIERDIEHEVRDKNEEIVLYCGGGYRSALAAENLKRMGYKNVVSMKGGWRAWNRLKYPIFGKRPKN